MKKLSLNVPGLLAIICLSGQLAMAATFPPQGDDTTPSMGVFRLTVDPAFRYLMTPSGALVAYPGYKIADGKLTSPLCIDNATTIGRSASNTRPYSGLFPVALGAGSWDSIAGYAAYAAIPTLWSGAVPPTQEVLTEIKSFSLLSVGAGTAGKQCPPDPRIPVVPLQWPMVKAGTFAGVTPRSLGMVQETTANGAADPDFPARSFFDIFVEVNLPPVAGTVSSTAFPVTGAVLYNDLPLIITNLNLTSFPPSVIYIHGETLAVPVKFKVSNPPYWSAGNIFGYLVLAGHGTVTNDCNDPNGQSALLDAVLGPIGTSKPELPIEWPRTNVLCPSAGSSYDSVRDEDVLTFGAIKARNFSHTNLVNPITPPPLNGNGTYSAPNTFVTLEVSSDNGATWLPAQAVGSVAASIHHTSDSGTTSTFDTEMLQLNLQGSSPIGPFMIRESPTKQSLGKHTIRPDAGLFRVSSFFDVFLELSINNGATWIPANRALRVQPSPPSASLILNCSPDITVTATSPAGAVVYYTSSAIGGCNPPPTVNCNPPSGSTFPIGTTIVTCTASDSCGQVVNCSFQVHVNPPVPTAPEYFTHVNVLPPPNSIYISPALWHALYANGIIIRDIRHQGFTQHLPPPPLNASQLHSFSSTVICEISFDNGTTFQPVIADANVTVQVTHSFDSAGRSFFDTEMLQLDLIGSGFRLRESPTLQSTGQTTVRPVAGGYMISSFFDIFTELSTDGGVSWMPAQQAAHVELRTDPAQADPIPEPTRLLPPPKDTYVSPELWHALFAQGIVIKDVRHKLFTDGAQPPASGTNIESFNSTVDMQVSTDGGNTFQYARSTAPVQITVASTGSGNTGLYDTEMMALSLTTPNGVMIRESPTEPSRGSTLITGDPDFDLSIRSFFDIFMEVSLDNGATWSPATNGPVRMQLEQQAVEVTTVTPNLPMTNQPYVSPDQWHALYANGIIITNASHDRFTQTQPPPLPNGNQIENFGSVVSGQISMNGGASFVPFTATANSTVQVTSRSDLDSGHTRFFDTEMLALSISGLPSGVMLRESPSKASLGKTTERFSPSDNTYRVASFFDIFTEVSLDNGATWSPSLTHPATMSPSAGPANGITIACPANITVTATGPGGAVVFYTVTASGGCSPPPFVTANPPSGSTFPIGTTMVTAIASDACGAAANCSFTVTVNEQTPYTPPDFYSPTNNLPPTNTVYISPALWHVLYNNGIVIRDIRHRYFTQNQPPPPLNGTQVHTFSSQVDFDLSTDNGNTFQPASGTADVSVKVTHSADTTAGSIFDTEMLALDLTSGQIRLRESPTLQSTGATKIRQIQGGYMIDSFFDIFTEVSLDNGASWMPAQGAARVEMRNDPRTVPPATEPTPLLPPPDDSYVSPAKWHALYAQGIVIKDVSHKFFTGSLPPPPAGGTNTHSFNSKLDMKVSMNGGASFQYVRVSSPVQVTVASVGSGNSGMYDTEMTSLDLVGLPNGLMIRESPTLPSRGATQMDPQPDGTYRIGSFFDIFPEISLDGGQTWSPPTNGPVRMQLTQIAGEVPTTSPNLPVTNAPYVSPEQWHAAYANGIYISNVMHSGFTQGYPPPPPPNGSQTENFGSTVSGLVSMNGGATFTPFSAQVAVAVGVSNRADLASGGTTFYDTEMLSLNLSGGTLPGGVMIRESPSKASLGRTSERATSDGYRINSFFDIFTEVSTDGGNTWSPSTNPPATMTPRLPPKRRIFPNPNIPPTNSQYISPQQWHALYANGIIISNVTHKRFLANLPPPPPRSTNTHNFGSKVTFMIAMGPNQPFQPMTANADCLVSVGNSGSQSREQVFQTEMLSLNLSGGTLPAGVMIRESPTRHSTGETRYIGGTGRYRVSSFFDIWTELSTDGGQTWSPASGPGYMELRIDPGVPPTTLLNPHMQAGHPAFSLQSQIGLQYVLQYKNKLEDPTWTTLGITPGGGQPLTLSDLLNTGQSQRYYRVEVQEDDLQ